MDKIYIIYILVNVGAKEKIYKVSVGFMLFFIYMNERKKWKIIFFHLTPSTHTYL